MTAGKMLHSLNDHTDAITSVSFHPTEFLMSTASADGIVKVSDLQTFECVSTSNPSNETASVIEFTADGQELLAATPSGLKVKIIGQVAT